MESQARYARIDKSTHVHWSISATASLFFYCSGNFILKSSPLSVFTKKLSGSIGYLLCMLIMFLSHIIILKLQNGPCPTLYPESIFNSKKGMTPGFSTGILGGVFLFFAELSYLYAWAADPSGAGIIFFLLMGVVPICSFFSYFFFDEPFKKLQIVGIVICVLGISVVGAVEIEFSELEGEWIAYVFGVISMLCFSIRNLSAKHMEKREVDVYTVGMLNCLGEVLAGGFLFGYVVVYQKEIWSVREMELVVVGAAGTLIALGQYFFNQAVMTGNIGVVISLFNLNGFGFLLLDFWVYGFVPRIMSLVMFGVVLIGIGVMVFGDKILEDYDKKKRATIVHVL